MSDIIEKINEKERQIKQRQKEVGKCRKCHCCMFK